jgi:prepilin-type N-terminal cleavage/methylation domain-containing protein
MSLMWQRIREHRAVDSGVTLVETLVTMVLLAVVSTLVTGAVVNAARGLTHTDDETTGLADAKVILERMARDAREARGIVCDGAAFDPTCSYHLQLWIDSNSDYVKQTSEIVTWQLVPDADGEHFDVYRTQGLGAGGTSKREASTLIVKTLFKYEAGKTPEQSQIVYIKMQYDAIVGRGTAERTVVFTARLRNKGTK